MSLSIVPSMPCLFSVKLLFCRVLLPGFVRNIQALFPSNLFSMYYVKVQVVQLYNSTDMATTCKNSHFILSERLDCHIVINLLTAVHALLRHKLTSLSKDEILLLTYVNWPIGLRCLLFNEEITSSWLKHMNYRKVEIL